MSIHASRKVRSRESHRIVSVYFAALLSAAGMFVFPKPLLGQGAAIKSNPTRLGAEADQRPSGAQVELERAGAADAPPAGKTKLHRLLDESANGYLIYSGDARAEPLKLKCVLRWANLTRGSVDGATYIWMLDGRPLATVCVYPWAGRLCDNFQSLAEGPIAARLDGREVWRCEKPGVRFQVVPSGPKPEKSAAGRQRQMKSLAGQFRTTLMGWNAADTDREELRMLPRPVHQHEEGGLVKNAIFAFVQGTDPEAFLLLEVRSKAADSEEDPQWHFAMARRTSGWLETRYKEELVWKVERLHDYSDPKQPHFQYVHPTLLDDAGGSK